VCDFGGPTARVHLVGVSISLEKNFYRLSFTPPLSGRLIGPSAGTRVARRHRFSSRSLIFSLSINSSDWLARLATDRRVTCAARGGDVLFSFHVNTLFARQVGPEKVNNTEAYEDWLRDMGIHGSPLTRVLEVPVKWTRPVRSPTDMQVGSKTLSTTPATLEDLG
jgi:hypothetical protein